MMKKIIILLLVLICTAGIAFGQQQKVAVYVTGGSDAGINKVLGDQLVAAIANSGKYIAIERTNSFLAELGKEQNYQRTGNVDDNEISRLGKQFGVQLVCIAEVNDVFGQKYVSARLIDVESAEVVNTSNAGSRLNNMEELMAVTKDITTELMGKTVKEKAAEAAKEKAAEAAGYIIVGNLAIQINVGRHTDWDTAAEMARQSRVGGYSDWRLPTNAELPTVLAEFEKDRIGDGVGHRECWSSTEGTYFDWKEKREAERYKPTHYKLASWGAVTTDGPQISNVVLVRSVR